jgi:hypothetical protein
MIKLLVTPLILIIQLLLIRLIKLEKEEDLLTKYIRN